MKKAGIICILMIIAELLLINGILAEIRINEIELNPEGQDSGNEWIELYSNEEINLTGWRISNSGNQSIELNKTFQGYLIIEFNNQWLDNEEEFISLFNGLNLIDSSLIISDDFNNGNSWTYCNGWIFKSSTKGSENNCQQNNVNNTDENQENEIYFELDWDEEDIINGKDFEIKTSVFNLKDKEYDVKIFIRFEDNDTIISESYHEDNEEWESGNYYIEKLFKGSGNKTKDIELRIKESYENFRGDAVIEIRIRETGVSSYLKQTEKDIEILEKKQDNSNQNNDEDYARNIVLEDINKKSNFISGDVIQLGADNSENSKPEDIKTEGIIIYESKNELIKKYSVYCFALLCAMLCVLFGFNKLDYLGKRNKERDEIY